MRISKKDLDKMGETIISKRCKGCHHIMSKNRSIHGYDFCSRGCEVQQDKDNFCRHKLLKKDCYMCKGKKYA